MLYTLRLVAEPKVDKLVFPGRTVGSGQGHEPSQGRAVSASTTAAESARGGGCVGSSAGSLASETELLAHLFPALVVGGDSAL